jgi:monofunctional glycosyltransferase
MWAFTKLAWFLFLRRWLIRLFLGFITLSLILVLLFKWVNPTWNLTMLNRKWNAEKDGFRITKTWVPIEKINRNMQLAAICGEDQHFCDHHGFDLDALQKAVESNASGKAIRGGSTISQQTAKNVFLWGGRSYIRKGLEAWFTLLIEFIWGKQRIMEVYLNIVETGDGLFGVEAAAQKHYHTSAQNLTQIQAAAISSIFPSPIRWKLKSRIAGRRQYLILKAMRKYGIELRYLTP